MNICETDFGLYLIETSQWRARRLASLKAQRGEKPLGEILLMTSPSHDLSSGPMTSSGSDSDPITRRANYTFVIIIWKNCMMKTLLIG